MHDLLRYDTEYRSNEGKHKCILFAVGFGAMIISWGSFNDAYCNVSELALP